MVLCSGMRSVRAFRLVVVGAMALATLAAPATAGAVTTAEVPTRSAVSRAAGSDDGFEARAARAVRALPGMWWYDALKVRRAHKQATGRGVTIALIDGPLDPSIPELQGQQVTAARGYCDGRPEVASGRVAHHATSMAALMGGSGRGTGPGGAGIAGIAPDAMVRVYSVYDEVRGPDTETIERLDCRAPNDVKTLPENVAGAIRDAVRDGAKVICIPLSFSATEGTIDAIASAYARGAVVVSSAGNEGEAIDYPASEGGVVPVGAVDRHARVWRWSNRDDFSMVTAPGVNMSAGGYVGGEWDSTEVWSGTSGSAALVAGALASVAEKYPDASGKQLLRHVVYRSGADERLNWSVEYGFGIVAVNRMLAVDPGRWRDSDPLAHVLAADFIGSGYDELTGSPPVRWSPRSAGREREPPDGEALGWAVPVGIAGAVLVVLAGLAFVAVRRRTRVAGPARPVARVGSSGQGG